MKFYSVRDRINKKEIWSGGASSNREALRRAGVKCGIVIELPLTLKHDFGNAGRLWVKDGTESLDGSQKTDLIEGVLPAQGVFIMETWD